MIGIKLLLLMVISKAVAGIDQTIRRLNYKLNRDIISLEGGGTISFVLAFIDSTAPTSTLEIETEQWVHDHGFEISTPSHLSVYTQGTISYYPKITAYLRLRQPLAEIILTGSTTLTTVNTLITDTLSLKLSGASDAKILVQINSKLYVAVSGAAKLYLIGFVNDTGNIHVNGAGKVDASLCPMNIVSVDASGASKAYVIGKQAVDIYTSGAANVYYEGSLRSRNKNNFSWVQSLFDFTSGSSKSRNENSFSWIKSLFGFTSGSSKAANRSINNFMLFFIIYIFLF